MAKVYDLPQPAAPTDVEGQVQATAKDSDQHDAGASKPKARMNETLPVYAPKKKRVHR